MREAFLIIHRHLRPRFDDRRETEEIRRLVKEEDKKTTKRQ